MLRAFGHRVAVCCDMLGVVGSSFFLLQLTPLTKLVQLLITEVITTHNSNTITNTTYTT